MLVEVFLLSLALCLALYLYLTWNYSYWKNVGVCFETPSLIFGNIKDLLLMKVNEGDLYGRIYRKYPNEAAVGMYSLRQPMLLVRDPGLAKEILIKKFHSFHDNQFYIEPSVDPVVTLNPFLASGERWKQMRSLVSQGQTLSRIRSKVDHMVKVAENMREYLEENHGKSLETKFLCGQYTSDVVTGAVYSIETNSFKDPNSPFRIILQKLFTPNLWFNLVFMLALHAPRLGTLLRLRFFDAKVLEFFTKLIQESMEYRKKENIKGVDYLQMLMDYGGLSLLEITGLTLTFMSEGYETSSTTLSHAVHLLGVHSDVQDKLRQELLEVPQVERYSFDTLHSLPYLDAFLCEVLRLRPPGFTMNKKCTQPCVLTSGGKQYPIRVGFNIVLPLSSIQLDENLYPEADKFDPDRFYKKPPLEDGSYLPFSLGPRQCVGMKFALTQMKVLIASLVSNFRIEAVTSDSDFKMEAAPLAFVKNGLWVKFYRINSK